MKNTETAKQESTNDYNLENAEPFRPRPHFEIDNRGVWWVNVRTDKDGDIIEAEPLFLSDPIDIIGTGQDNDGAYYQIIKFKDKITRRHKTAALPQAEIGTVQGWQRLQNFGLVIMSGRAKREKLADYLQKEGSQAAFTITDRAGLERGQPTLLRRRGNRYSDRQRHKHSLQRRHQPKRRLHRKRQPQGMAGSGRAIRREQ